MAGWGAVGVLSSPYDAEVRVRTQACTRAVAPSTNTPDYSRILELCDLLNRDDTGRAHAVAAMTLTNIMKEETNYLVLFLTLHVVELCVMNCGTAFHDRIATERFMKALIHLGGKYLKKKEYFKIEDANSAKASDQISGNQKALKFSVRMKAMALVQSLGLGFQNDARHAIFYREYQALVAKGIHFPVHKPTDFAPIHTPAPHHSAPQPSRATAAAPARAAPSGGAGQATPNNFEVILTNLNLLNEMLRNNDDVRTNDLIQDLVKGATTVKPQVQTWISNNTDHPQLGTALQVNDLLESTLDLYSRRLAGGSAPPLHEGKSRNSLGAGGSGVGGENRPRRNSSSSSSSSVSEDDDDDFRLISNRHRANTPVLQPIASSPVTPISSLPLQPIAGALPPSVSAAPAAPGPAVAAAAPPGMYYAAPPGVHAYSSPNPPHPVAAPPPGVPMYVLYPPYNVPQQYGSPYAAAPPPVAAAPPPFAASAPPPSAPAPPPSAAAPPPVLVYSPPPPSSLPSSPPAPPLAAVSSPPANNPFASPPLSPAHAPSSASDHPQPRPGVQPVYVLWPPNNASPASPAVPPSHAAAPGPSPFAPVPSPVVAAGPAQSNPFLETK